MLLAVAAIPPAADALVQAARLTGLTVADVRQRLTGLLPRVLLNEPAGPGVVAVAQALRDAGFGVLECDPDHVPVDDDRVLARTLAFRPDALVVGDAIGGEHVCRAEDIELVQRGTRVAVDERTVTRTTRKVDPVRAVLTGGLMISKKVQQKSTIRTESHEGFLLVQRRAGAREILLAERRLDFRGLGADMQPATAANLTVMATRLRALRPDVALDDRVSRAAFLAGLPMTSVDPVDLGVHLVLLAHRAGLRG